MIICQVAARTPTQLTAANSTASSFDNRCYGEFPCEAMLLRRSHFRLLRVVGRGAFGKVRIVERRDTGLTFALKYIRKGDVIRTESVRNILRERRMLEQLNYQFICNLRYSFQDIEYMYLVVDLMNGGDLRFHISRKVFTEEAVRFWISELGLAIRYIHSQGIIHRDIKPDNVLLDAEGHNVASDFTPGKLLTSKSGTLAYLAPEVYKGKGYSSSVDWWSLGVLFYECIYNKRPFEKISSSDLQEQILKADPKFPVTDPPVSIVCMHAISSALEQDPNKRMGCTKDEGFSSFTDNPFFRAIDFYALERKEVEPVFVPSSGKTNFDATYDLEEMLLEEAPLEARARRQKPREQLREDATEKQIREEEMYQMIEEHFTPFDYTTIAYERFLEGSEACQRWVDSTQFQTVLSAVEKKKPLDSQVFHKYSTAPLNTSKYYSLSPDCSRPVESNPQDLSAKKHTYEHNSNCSFLPLLPLLESDHQSSQATAKKSVKDNDMHLVVGEGESWSALAHHDSTLPAEAKAEIASKVPGRRSFLGIKKGRNHSPKTYERGILSKGSRVIVSGG
ncbi:unnamed protein product [Blumeria hordei]|uniref:Uncharacterized protein n=1 Tax=Blumeria hordei TaxID=2867405 RepID=A0A383UIJ9_BLUHO|nr:unnamed protein product [Blumeria hordei]